MLGKKKNTVKGDLSSLPKEKPRLGSVKKISKNFVNFVRRPQIIVLLFVTGIGIAILLTTHAAVDPYSPDYVPPVPKQQLIDDITQYHDGGHFPFTPPSWNNIQAQTFTELNTPGHKTPGSVALNSRTAGIYEWVELSTRENSPTNLNAVVEFREVGMATYRSGAWEKIMEFKHNQLNGPLKAIVNDVSVGSTFYQNIPGYTIGLNWSPSNNRMVGFGLGNGQFGTTYPSNIPGWPDERLKAHASIAGNSYGAGVDYCSRINCAGATIQAVQGWVIARVVTREGKSYQDLINAGDTAGAQQLKDSYYVLMPGWDQFTDQQVYDGTMGRARRVLPEWQTFTTTSMSQAQINGGLPAPPIPGYTTTGTTNQAPTISLTSSPTSATTGQSYTLTANASDSDGSVSKIEIFQAGVSKKVCTAVTTCTFATSNTTAATYTYTAVATDNSGATTTAAVSVTVGSGGTTTGKVYLVGDSWMERERDTGQLAATVAAKGWSPSNITINARGGRTPADGLRSVANDASTVAQADVIAIALGQNDRQYNDPAVTDPTYNDRVVTNPTYSYVNTYVKTLNYVYTRADYDSEITAMVSLLHSINPSIKIIWFEPADPGKTLIDSALSAASGTLTLNTSLYKSDVFNGTLPNAYVDTTYHPLPGYAATLSQLIANGIGAPGVVTPPNGFTTNGTYNDTDPAISYTGSWTADASSTSSYSGDEHYTNTPGDSATFQFTGEQLQLVSHRNTDMGQATIKIDGVAQSTVGEWYANPAQTGAINWTSNKLSKTNHTVVITVNSSKNAASAGNYVSIDKIVISDAPVTTGKPGDTNNDAKIDITDLTNLAVNFGQSGKTLAQGDLDGNGIVNIADLTILVTNWGK